MKVGDLVRQKVDVNICRTGMIIRGDNGFGVCKVFWYTQPFGREKITHPWMKDLEVLSASS